MTFCMGHEAQEALFINLFKNGNIPHAMIFSGIEGIGKTTMAFRLARFLLKNATQSPPQDYSDLDVDPQDYAFRLVSSGSHPDMLHIHRGFDNKKEKQDSYIKVESIRKVAPFLRRTSSNGGWRVVIIEDADTMNRNAQNAILKVLEEPPANVLIILIAHRPGMLIPTIHSRARTIIFSPLSAMVLETLLAMSGRDDLSPRDVELLTQLSEGSIGRALTYLEGDGLDMTHKVLELMGFAHKREIHKINEFAMSIGTPSQDAQYRTFIYTFLWVMRKVLFAKARGYTDLPEYIRNGATVDLCARQSLEYLITLNDDIKNIFERVDFSNLDRRDAVRSALTMLSHSQDNH
ncbi:MAG: DNA polymerase III subunit delta' [Alphaproteobacteria bacterium]